MRFDSFKGGEDGERGGGVLVEIGPNLKHLQDTLSLEQSHLTNYISMF